MSFLGDYHIFTRGNEAPPAYHLWSGLSALSSIISRRVWIEQGYFRVFPNLYVVLVGPPGVKKTTAMSIAKSLIRVLSPANEIPFSAECQTKESIVKEMPDLQRTFQIDAGQKPLVYTPYSIFVTELSQFLGFNSLGMIDFLTTIWDQEVYDCKTKNKGNQYIVGPYLTMLACTTPDWITTYLKTDVITGGFSRRALFVLEHDDGDPIPFPTITTEQGEAWSRVIDYSKELFKIGGEFQWDTDASEYYADWYIKHKNAMKRTPPEPTIRGYLGSKHVMLLKVAMLVSLSESMRLVMTLKSITDGLDIVNSIEEKLPRVFQGIGRNELNSIANQVIDTIRVSGPLPEKKLQSIMWTHANGQELVQIFQHLESSGKIQRVLEKDVKTQNTIRTWIKLPEQKMPG